MNEVRATVLVAAEEGGTRVTLRHRGFARVAGDVGCELGYAAGWRELLGWYQESIDELTKEGHVREPVGDEATTSACSSWIWRIIV